MSKKNKNNVTNNEVKNNQEAPVMTQVIEKPKEKLLDKAKRYGAKALPYIKTGAKVAGILIAGIAIGLGVSHTQSDDDDDDVIDVDAIENFSFDDEPDGSDEVETVDVTEG